MFSLSKTLAAASLAGLSLSSPSHAEQEPLLSQVLQEGVVPDSALVNHMNDTMLYAFSQSTSDLGEDIIRLAIVDKATGIVCAFDQVKNEDDMTVVIENQDCALAPELPESWKQMTSVKDLKQLLQLIGDVPVRDVANPDIIVQTTAAYNFANSFFIKIKKQWDTDKKTVCERLDIGFLEEGRKPATLDMGCYPNKNQSYLDALVLKVGG